VSYPDNKIVRALFTLHNVKSLRLHWYHSRLGLSDYHEPVLAVTLPGTSAMGDRLDPVVGGVDAAVEELQLARNASARADRRALRQKRKARQQAPGAGSSGDASDASDDVSDSAAGGGAAPASAGGADSAGSGEMMHQSPAAGAAPRGNAPGGSGEPPDDGRERRALVGGCAASDSDVEMASDGSDDDGKCLLLVGARGATLGVTGSCCKRGWGFLCCSGTTTTRPRA
jgi:hypothetical protein